MDRSKRLNIKYSLIMFFYYIVNASFGAYGTIFLLERGLREAKIGVIFSVASILALLFQVILSRLYKVLSELGTKEFLKILTILSFILVLGLNYFKAMTPTAVFFVLSWASFLSMVPLLSSIFIEFNNIGYETNFNIPRAFGSLSYSIACVFYGRFFAKEYSLELLTIFIIISTIILFFLILSLPASGSLTVEGKITKKAKTQGAFTCNDKDGACKNFKWILLGVVFLLIMHNIGLTYLYQVFQKIGGDSSNVGIAIAISAFVEIPTLSLYGKLSEKLSHRFLLMLSAIGFLVKTLIITFATSIGAVYLGHFFQIFGFALYIVAIIEYTNEIMNPIQAISQQFNINIALSLGGIIGNIVGGFLVDYYGTFAMLSFGLVTTILGVICFYLGLRPLTYENISNKY